jgi:LysM repeat protein
MKIFFRRKVVVVLLTIMVLQLVVLPMAASAAPAASGGGFWHTVCRGETLFSIGRRYGVNPWAIARSNSLPNPNYIQAGWRLWIPAAGWGPGWQPGWQPGCWGGCRTYHTVRYGDNLYRIARWYGTSPWAIARANGIYNPNLIYAGRTLCIP